MAKRSAMERVLPVYCVDKDLNVELKGKMDSVFSEIDKVRAVPAGMEGNLLLNETFGVASVSSVVGLADSDYQEFKSKSEATLASLLAGGLVSFTKKVELLDSDQRMITAVKENGVEKDISILDLKTVSEARDEVYRVSISSFARNRRVRNAFSEMLISLITPNFVFNKELTDKKKEETLLRTPPVEETVQKNEVIVRKGYIITYADLQRLQAIEEKITKKKVALDVIGLGIIVLFFIIILAAYLYHFDKPIYYSLSDTILINTVICFNLILNKMLLSAVDAEFAIYLIPSSLAALLLAILLKPRIGFCVAIGMSIVTGIITEYNGLIMISTLLTSLLGVYTLIDVRRRSQFFVVGALVGLVNFLTVAAFLILQEMSFQDAVNKAVYALGNGGIIIVLLFPLVWLFEKIFDKTTSISLLELSDLNHPLLKRLDVRKPLNIPSQSLC